MSHACLIPDCDRVTPSDEDMCSLHRVRVSAATRRLIRTATSRGEYDEALQTAVQEVSG